MRCSLSIFELKSVLEVRFYFPASVLDSEFRTWFIQPLQQYPFRIRSAPKTPKTHARTHKLCVTMFHGEWRPCEPKWIQLLRLCKIRHDEKWNTNWRNWWWQSAKNGGALIPNYVSWSWCQVCLHKFTVHSNDRTIKAFDPTLPLTSFLRLAKWMNWRCSSPPTSTPCHPWSCSASKC